MLKWLVRILGGLVVLVVVGVGAGFAYRGWRQHEGEEALRISSPNGIDEAMFVPIRGHDEWIAIRGRDRRNPVLLMLHGGPGGPTTYSLMARFLPYEKDYTIVHWDQPGAGRTFERDGDKVDPALSIAGVVADGIAVSEYLRNHLHTDKIILLGWSWGTIIGIEMARARPDLFTAFVGTGQEVNWRKGEVLDYSFTMAEARASGNAKAVAELAAIGPPPYNTWRKILVQRKWAQQLFEPDCPTAVDLVFAPRNSLADVFHYGKTYDVNGPHFLGPKADGPAMQVDLAAEGMEFRIPIFVIDGTQDGYTPPELARDYVDKLSAPEKGFAQIQGAGHSAVACRSEEFLKLMNERLRALPGTEESPKAP
jgi:pimeloyl-ACP methyl ester carboxylesterase